MLRTKEIILIVDDNIELNDAIKRVLETSYEVLQAHNSQEALDLINNNLVSLIILDYDLQEEGSDGVELSKKFRLIRPFTYILMLSGITDFNKLQKAVNEGKINKFINKPVQPKLLHKYVGEGIAKYAEGLRISSILTDNTSINTLKDLFAEVINEKFIHKDDEFEVVGLIISKNALPIHSRFNEEIMDFTNKDTLFTGILNALITIGTMTFTANTVQAITFNDLTLHFHVHSLFLIIIISINVKDPNDALLMQKIDRISKRIIGVIEEEGLDDKSNPIIKKEKAFKEVFMEIIP